ncbi:MAG: 30S ribosomal protein S2 [Candidatus Omnitrophica bacterium]|nr:30S ribosomal protein S2 [Candidatus Omnitrophota bacterium]
MAIELIKKLLEAGVHFGHQSRRWNPKMKKFIFGERGGIYIIDLEKTAEKLLTACDYMRDVASKGGVILFVGTKKQASDVIQEEANRCEMPYVKYRWMGGLLTNLETVKKSIRKLSDIEKMESSGITGRLTKKEKSLLMKEKERLLRDLGGIRNMPVVPQAIFMVDTKKEEIGVAEANRLGIPVVGLIDTNSDPDLIQYPIPGNDDAVKSIKFIAGMITDSIIEGRKEFALGKKAQAQTAAVEVIAA